MREIKFRWWNGQKMITGENLQVLARNLKDMDNLMQFTGLFDKEGKEIYEGDICRIELASAIDMSDPDPAMRVIQFCEEEARITHFRIDGKSAGTGYTYCKNNVAKFYEVIGNIYEHSHLLEG